MVSSDRSDILQLSPDPFGRFFSGILATREHNGIVTAFPVRIRRWMASLFAPLPCSIFLICQNGFFVFGLS